MWIKVWKGILPLEKKAIWFSVRTVPCDNWTADDFSMPMLNLEHCSVNNLDTSNSKLQQWTFYDCNVSGDFFNSKLYSVSIFGGSFKPILQECTLSNAHIKIDHLQHP